MNDKTKLIGVFTIVFIIAFGLVVVAMYMGMANGEVNVDNMWSQVRTQLQRRADLIPNIVEATKDYMAYEQNLLTNITMARSAWTSAVESGNVEDQFVAGNALGEATNQILLVATVENYPQLNSQGIVLTMIDELAGTENRIAYRRELYNNAVANYNRNVKYAPGSWFAGMWGFVEKPFYLGAEGIDTVPKVDLT